MNFIKALSYAKRGYKIKLPSWRGFWYWDSVKNTIFICSAADDSSSPDPVFKNIDFRDTSNLEGTLINCLSEEWVIIPENLFPDETVTFTFSEALTLLKQGEQVSRLIWEDSDNYVTLIKTGNAFYRGCPMKECLGFHTTTGEMQPGWIPSQEDLLSKDWIIYNLPHLKSRA